jgi:uncharacterized protein (TIGR00255 family)
MLRSMTGFGAGAARTAMVEARVELRAVNHRFLQLKLRLPSELGALESELEARARQRLSRGAVSGSIVVAATEEAAGATVDADAAARLLEQAERAGEALGLEDRVTLRDLLALPGVVRYAATELDLEAAADAVRQAFDEALDGLVAMREREGAALAADLLGHVDSLDGLVVSVRERSPEAVREHQAALAERVRALLGPERPVEDKDLAREIALIADRLDVAEETSRLGIHLEHLREQIASGGAIGRKLDFLVQECLREVNTIGSKCNDAGTARAVIDAKTVVERLREQVQNVE